MASQPQGRSSRPSIQDAYAELLSQTRGLRREQQQAREVWYAGLLLDRKEEILFELEILLKGVACFSNPRNHPGAPRRAPVVAIDFASHLAYWRDGVARVVGLARTLLGAARTTVATASMTTEAPTVDTWACPRCGATMILGPILSALQLTTITFGFDTS